MRTLTKIYLLALCLACTACGKDDPVSPLESLPSAGTQLSASARPFGGGYFGTGEFSGVKIYDSTERLVAELYASSGAGELVLTDAHGLSSGSFSGDNLSVAVAGVGKVGLYAGPVNRGLLVDGLRVIGPRLPGIADAVSPEDAVVKLNALLASMREHGLIEPTDGPQFAAGRRP